MTAAVDLEIAEQELELEAIRCRKALRERQAQRQKVAANYAEWNHAISSDFRAFCGIVKIRDKAGGRVPFKLKRGQARSVSRYTGRDARPKGRQCGSTTLELVRDVWKFATREGAGVVVVCQSQKDNQPIHDLAQKIRTILTSIEEAGLKLDFATKAAGEWRLRGTDSSLRILGCGASEQSATSAGVGGTITHLHCTEVAKWHQDQTTYHAIMDAVPNDGEVIFESTANGARGLFYEICREAKSGKGRYALDFMPWFDDEDNELPLLEGEVVTPANKQQADLVSNCGIRPEQLKWYQKKLAEKLGRQDNMDQEYPSDEETCWLVGGGSFFEREKCVAMQRQVKAPIAIEMGGALRIWKQPDRSCSYIIPADPSEGTGGDPGAAMVLDRATGEHVATLHGQFPVGRMGELLALLGMKYNCAEIFVERNNHGHAVILALTSPPRDTNRLPYPRVFKAADGKHGWYSTAITRMAALDALEDAIRRGTWSTPDAEVVSELLTFVVNDRAKAEAAHGAHDDLVITSAIGVWACERPKSTKTVTAY